MLKAFDLAAACRQSREERKQNCFEPIIRYIKFRKDVKAVSMLPENQKDIRLRETVLKCFRIESEAGQELFKEADSICGFSLCNGPYEQVKLIKAEYLRGYEVQRVCFWLYIMLGEERLTSWLLRASDGWGAVQDETMHQMYRLRGGYRNPKDSIDLYRRLIREGFSAELLQEARERADEMQCCE